MLLTIAIGRVGFQTMARLRDDLPRLTHTVRLSLWIVLMLGIPMALVLCFGAPEVVRVLYGARYAESAGFLRFLALSNFAWMLISVAFWLAVALGHRRVSLSVSAVQAATLAIVATPLTLWLGANGTLIGVGVAMVVALALGCRYIFRTVPLTIRETFGGPLIASGLTTITLFAFLQIDVLHDLPILLRLSLLVAVTIVAFFGCMLVIRRDETIARLVYLRRTWRGKS
jgi:O-antigen/teichoic acid export membrane protein